MYNLITEDPVPPPPIPDDSFLKCLAMEAIRRFHADHPGSDEDAITVHADKANRVMLVTFGGFATSYTFEELVI